MLMDEVFSPVSTLTCWYEAVDWNDVARRANSMAIEKGWWYKPRTDDEIQANFHAEVSEAWEAYRISGDAGLLKPIESVIDGKPEGFWVELSDLVIRLGDFVAAECGDILVDIGLGSLDDVEDCTVAGFICYLHSTVSVCFRFGRTPIKRILAACVGFAVAHDIDLASVVETKMAYNTTRPHRHGNKHA